MFKKVVKDMLPSKLRSPIQRIRNKSVYHEYYDKNQCVFIHIPKAAGQSVALSLFNDKHPGHWGAKDFIWEDKAKFKEYYKFTFVRNPWDRLVSAFMYLNNSTPYKNDQKFAQNVLSKFNSFDDFVINGLSKQEILGWVHFRPQYDFLTINNQLVVDYVGRLETISTDFNHIAEMLGISCRLDRVNQSPRRNYREYYTDETKEIVNRVYLKDIELFEYEF